MSWKVTVTPGRSHVAATIWSDWRSAWVAMGHEIVDTLAGEPAANVIGIMSVWAQMAENEPGAVAFFGYTHTISKAD